VVGLARCRAQNSPEQPVDQGLDRDRLVGRALLQVLQQVFVEGDGRALHGIKMIQLCHHDVNSDSLFA